MPQYSDMLTYLRKRSGLSQQELADKLGLTRSAISMYEAGKREPNLEVFELFADFYNVDMNTLTGKSSSATGESFDRNDQLVLAISKARHDPDFLSLINDLADLPREQYENLKALILALKNK